MHIKHTLFLLPVLLPLLFFLDPLWGIHAGNSTDRGYAGYKLATEGFIKHRFGHYVSQGEYYTHHPPLPHILTGISFKLIGDNDIANRLPPYIFSVIGSIFFYLLIKELFDKKLAIISLLFYVLTPVYIYYASINIHENYSVPALLGSVYFLTRYSKKQQIRHLFLSLFFILISTLSSWHVWFFYLTYAIISKRKLSLMAFIVATCGIILAIAQNNWASQINFFTNVKDSLLFRIGLDNNKFSLLNSPLAVIYKLWKNITISLGLFSLPALVFVLSKKLVKQRLILSLFLYPFLPILIFSNAFYIHEYLFLYILPACALAQGLVVLKYFRGMGRFAIIAGILLAFAWNFSCVAIYKIPVYKFAYEVGVQIRNENPKAKTIVYLGQNPGDYSASILRYYARRDVIEVKSCEDLKNYPNGLIVISPFRFCQL